MISSKNTSLASLINPLMILPKISGCPNISFTEFINHNNMIV